MTDSNQTRGKVSVVITKDPTNGTGPVANQPTPVVISINASPRNSGLQLQLKEAPSPRLNGTPIFKDITKAPVNTRQSSLTLSISDTGDSLAVPVGDIKRKPSILKSPTNGSPSPAAGTHKRHLSFADGTGKNLVEVRHITKVEYAKEEAPEVNNNSENNSSDSKDECCVIN